MLLSECQGWAVVYIATMNSANQMYNIYNVLWVCYDTTLDVSMHVHFVGDIILAYAPAVHVCFTSSLWVMLKVPAVGWPNSSRPRKATESNSWA